MGGGPEISLFYPPLSPTLLKTGWRHAYGNCSTISSKPGLCFSTSCWASVVYPSNDFKDQGKAQINTQAQINTPTVQLLCTDIYNTHTTAQHAGCEFRPVQSAVVPLQLWEGCACLTVISWMGILWHHTDEKQTPFAFTHWPQPLSFACNSVSQQRRVNSLGSESSYSIARVIWSQQQLYATRPAGGWGVRCGVAALFIAEKCCRGPSKTSAVSCFSTSSCHSRMNKWESWVTPTWQPCWTGESQEGRLGGCIQRQIYSEQGVCVC